MPSDSASTRLRQELDDLDQSQHNKIIERILYLERWKPWIGVAAVVGAMIAAVARAIEGNFGVFLVILGAVLAGVCGLIAVLFDHKKLELLSEVTKLKNLVKSTIVEFDGQGEKLLDLQAASDSASKKATSFDAMRLARIEAMRSMIESIEAALLSDANVKISASGLLETAIGNLRRSIDYNAGDFLTFTIFVLEFENSIEKMVPIARQWTDPSKAKKQGRSWPIGQGYTGVLWSLAAGNPKAFVVESDTTTSAAKSKYPIEARDDEHEKQYVSVASFPILVGESDKVWGAVTATSNRGGVFSYDDPVGRQSVEAVRDLALAAGLLAKLRKS